MNDFPLLTLNPAEAVFAPFHDPEISPSLAVVLKTPAALGCRWTQIWCGVDLMWEKSRPGETAVEVVLEGRLRREFYDHFLFCLGTAPEVDVRFLARVDGAWQALTDWRPGTGKRMEVTAPIPAGEITGISFQVRSASPENGNILLDWFGVGCAALVPAVTRKVIPYGADWTGLIDFPADWPDEPVFWRGLLFDPEALPALREKTSFPIWNGFFHGMEERARKTLDDVPEQWIGEFVPWSDIRYLREREGGAPALFNEMLVVGFVGLIRKDRSLALQALRYLMTIVHTTHWCCSAENRLRGSTWDQNCFTEEMYSTVIALLSDWYAWALTPRARSLIAQCLWDKGLAVIERSLMKYEYVHHINQGPWFCRARVLAGLLLEKQWPRTGSYVDRAHAEMIAGLENYVQEDGGIDEGIGYFWATMEATLPGSFAYARARGRKDDAASLLPEKIHRSESFVATLSSLRPGQFLLDGDNSNERVVSDAPAILAHYFPDQIYRDILAACLGTQRKESYFTQYFGAGVYSFLFGPADLPPPRPIVPSFSQLPKTGHLTSARTIRGRTVRLHFAGAKANASHTHYDKGNVTLEVDDVPMLIDRGMIRYDDARHPRLKASPLHNVITPMSDEGIFPSQSQVTQATIPEGRGDAVTLEASIDLANVWRDHMTGCTRTVISPHPLEFTVEDRGELRSGGRIAFHLQALEPFRVEGRTAWLERDGVVLEIGGDWIREISQFEDLIDYAGRPVWHLVLVSESLRQFALRTRFSVRLPGAAS